MDNLASKMKYAYLVSKMIYAYLVTLVDWAVPFIRGDISGFGLTVSARAWTVCAMVSGGVGCFFLRETTLFGGGADIPITSTQSIAHGHAPKYGTVIFFLLVALLGGLHFLLYSFSPAWRKTPFVRGTEPNTLIIASVGLISFILPIICSEYIGDFSESNVEALYAFIAFLFDALAIHMALLPGWELQVVQCALGVVTTLYTFMFRNHKHNILINIEGSVALFIFLAIYLRLIRPGPLRAPRAPPTDV